MTVVACFQCYGHPLLIGDLMLSSWSEKPPATLPFDIPTIPDVNAQIPSDWGSLVVGLRQKIVVLDDTFAIAWAGSLIAARCVVREFEELISKGPLQFEQIKEVLDQTAFGELDLFITGLLVQRESADQLKVTRFGWDTKSGWEKPNPQVRGLGPIYVGGSGESDLLKAMNAVSTGLGNSDALTSCTTAITAAIAMTSLLSGEQSRTASGVSALYGGGFELATIATAAQSTINSVLGPIAAVTKQVNTLIASTGNTISNIATVGGVLPNNPIARQAASLNGQVAAMTSLPVLFQLQSVVGRMNSNLVSAGSAGQTVVTAGGDLQRLAANAYGDATAWTGIARANNLTDPQLSGINTITIPALPDAANGVFNA